jgi:hypothetical protein
MFAILRGIYGRFTSGKVKRTSTEGAQPGTRPYFAAVQQVRLATPERKLSARTCARARAQSHVRACADLIQQMPASVRARGRT